MAKKQIIILGGGYAGIASAKKLYKQFKKDNSVEITFIDKNTYHTLMTELHEVAGSRVTPDAVMISFQRIFSGTNINIVSDFITGIDFDNQKLVSNNNEYLYDYLILGTGGAPEFFDLPGIQNNSFSLWSLEDAIKIREHVEERFRLAAKEPDPEIRKQMLSFTVAGAGFTGIELIGEFAERKDTLCSRYHIDKSEVKLSVVEALDTILPIIEENLREKAVKYLEKKGVELHLGARIKSAQEGKVVLENGTEIPSDTFIWTCGIHGSEFTSRIDITKGNNAFGKCSIASAAGIHGMKGSRFHVDEIYLVEKRGRILVNEYMQSVDHENIFAVGDNLWFLENEKVLPQIVETALQTGETAAENIIADIKNEKKHSFKSNYHGFMVSIGSRYAVSNAGGIKLSGFFAMAMKHMINLHYLFGLAGLNTVWNYLKHEFFDMKDKRTFLGEHFSWKIQGWWALPLRAWLGIMWIAEALNKIGEGWLSFSSGTKSGWMFSPGIVQRGVERAASAAGSASDAVSAASAVAENAADTAVYAASGAADAVSAASDAAAYAASGAADAVSAASDAASYAATGAADAVSAASDAAAYAVTGAADAVSAASDAASYAATGAADAVSAASDAAAYAVSGAADAVAAASAVAETAVKNGVTVFGKIWDTGNPIIPYNSAFVTWFRETFMDSMMAYISYPLFQTMIVLVELAIGLALLGGLFTWLAAAASIAMCAVFTFSGMFSWDQAWFVFAAFLMLGGAGRSLGLDHWLMPFIKKWWNSTSIAKKSFLYLNEPVIRKKGKKNL